MKPMQQKRTQYDTSRPAGKRRPKATVPPRKRRRPRPPAPQPTSVTESNPAWKPVCPTAQRAYEAELFAELE
ncbi:hypothetical protein AB0O64_05805 [Streptomyces sp. NPDC088341]|uniref:hypothetical protein n=1 Tax=Streptomyces sp. NPDC088341 TaxID=3154870 RepID=UPI00342B7778